MSPVRPHQLNILLSPEELTEFKAIAEAYGITVSDLIRWLVQKEFRRPMALSGPDARGMKAEGLLAKAWLATLEAERAQAAAAPVAKKKK